MKFIYNGPECLVTLTTGKKTKDYALKDGGEIELPEDHPYVKGLIHLNRLQVVKSESTQPAPQPKANHSKGDK